MDSQEPDVIASLDQDGPSMGINATMRAFFDRTDPQRFVGLPFRTYDPWFEWTNESHRRRSDAGERVGDRALTHADVYFDEIARLFTVLDVGPMEFRMCGLSVLRPGLLAAFKAIGEVFDRHAKTFHVLPNSLGPFEPLDTAYAALRGLPGLSVSVEATRVFGPDGKPLTSAARLASGDPALQVRLPRDKIYAIARSGSSGRTIAIGDSGGDTESMVKVVSRGGGAVIVYPEDTPDVHGEPQFSVLNATIRAAIGGGMHRPPEQVFRFVRPADTDWRNADRQLSVAYAIADIAGEIAGISQFELRDAIATANGRGTRTRLLDGGYMLDHLTRFPMQSSSGGAHVPA